MKRTRWIMCLIFSCIFLVSCNNREGIAVVHSEENAKYTDVLVESESGFEVADGNGIFLGMQFFHEEPVQIYAERTFSNNADVTMEVYMHRQDDGRELLLQGIPWTEGTNYGFIGKDECYYFWGMSFLKKIDKGGKELFNISLAELNIRVQDICQLADNRVFLLIFDNANGQNSNGTKLAEMNPDTGEIKQINTISRNDLSSISAGGIAAAPEGLMIMTAEGIWVLNVEDGSKTTILSFESSSYQLDYEMDVEDFRVVEEDKVEILLTPRNGSIGYLETLKRTDVSKEKIPITIRAAQFTKNSYGNWLKEKITWFNQVNGTYHIVIEECGEGTKLEDYARLTSVEMSTGKGPDILCGPILEDYIDGMIEKGAFADLSPYMEHSEMKEEDYFPCAFNCWRDGEKIYGVNFVAQLSNYQVSEKVLGGREIPNIEDLTDALLAWQGKAVYMEGYDATDVLRNLLEGSDSLWGMIDWETESCDFEKELFGKLLEIAKRYGDAENNSYAAIAKKRYCGGFYNFDTLASQIESEYVTSGVLFDDGCYGAVLTDWTLAVNANSKHKEGAWEFISYLLSEESQVTFEHNSNVIAVHRGAFQTLADEAPDPNIIITRNGVEIEKANESEVAEMIEIIENAKPLPIRTVPILDIICEESEDYFNGTKRIEEVVAVIENRVQLYLEEN